MRNKSNYSAVHKNVMRDRANRSVTEQGIKRLREAFDAAQANKNRKDEASNGGSK
ncbi:hypothetical protein [Providencia rettgeri]|uniref:hypothetical protein n=1 Tax=Providencia rettgeri TaxID=587 RepID=UPI0013741889|nr:hypothetical protein BML2531_17530 [Providencia rettgeri]